MYQILFNKLFQEFIDKNSFLIVNSRIKNYTISSYDFSDILNILPNEKILLKNMLPKDSNNFNEIRNDISNLKLKNNITSAFCLLFNECVNINNGPQQKNLISSALKKYLSNILEEINSELLTSLEDKNSNNLNYNLSQTFKKNKKDLKNIIELLFLIIVYMLNKYKNIIDNTINNVMIKRINIKDLKSTKIKEELYLILILQQNLYWIELIIDCLLVIFQNLKNNKFRILINADNEFNNLDENFKISCFNCFLPLFNVIKKYATIKTNKYLPHLSVIDYLFNLNSICNINYNCFLPLKINDIDKVVFNLFECFIYEFLYDIDSLWKYFDFLNYSIFDTSSNDNIQTLYGFGIYLCNFVKTIAFIKDDNLTKIDFFNFYIFSYNLITNYFSRLNNHLYNILISLYDIIKNNFISSINMNLNYLQNLSNTLKDMLFHFMVFSFYNDSLKDIYSYNEILFNSIISHCFLKTIIPIYSLIKSGNTENLLIDILLILIENINKYKVILPLKCHFHKELITHNFLLILDYFMNIYENKLTNYLKENYKDNKINIFVYKLKNIFNNNLSCLYDHYNCINFIYSNHIIFMFNKILNNSGFNKNNGLDNILLRYIPNDKNFLLYKDINLNFISNIQKDSTNMKGKNNNFNLIYPMKDININININSNCILYQQNIFLDYDEEKFVGYSLENHFDKNTIKLLSQIELDEFKFNIINDKKYLVKNNFLNKNNNLNYSNILVNNGEFIEILGIDKKLNENILKIMENIQYTDKYIFKFIQDKVINNNSRNIKVSPCFLSNLKYYDLSFKMNYFEYQNQLKELLL